MNTYYVKLLLFIFLINTLVLPRNENYINNHYNISVIPNNTQRTIIKSRLLAQTQNQNPHYHNDPELKEMIDKLNVEALKKYQQTHDPYEQLRELVEKNGKKFTGRNGAEHMSTTEKELFETYEEVFGKESHIMLKSGMYPNDDEKSSSCEFTDTNNAKLETTKGKDKYLKHLKDRCTRAICFCSVGSFLLTFVGLGAARAAAAKFFTGKFASHLSQMTIFNMFSSPTLTSTLEAAIGCGQGAGDIAGSASTMALTTFPPYGIAALVLLILAVVLIILYIWLYKRRMRSLKHECKKHLCK